MKPKFIIGNQHSDSRGRLLFNNDFDISEVKRIYVIENSSVDFIRAWQGHKIEQRWFSAMRGSFEIKLIAIDDWDKPNPLLECETFQLKSGNLDILHIPSGYVSSIKALEDNSRRLLLQTIFLTKFQTNIDMN